MSFIISFNTLFSIIFTYFLCTISTYFSCIKAFAISDVLNVIVYYLNNIMGSDINKDKSARLHVTLNKRVFYAG